MNGAITEGEPIGSRVKDEVCGDVYGGRTKLDAKALEGGDPFGYLLML